MRYSIQLQADGTFVVLDAEGVQIGATFDDYEKALLALSATIQTTLAAEDDGEMDDDLAEGDGLLPDAWTSDEGIAFCDLLPGGRDFTECEWTWRDPSRTLVPLMFQQTNAGHYEADLVGYIEEFSGGGNATVHARGRFYDTEAGENARNVLLGGRRFGVSVDPSEAIDAEWVCTQLDEEGWCEAGVTKFTKYEIAGLTMIGFPGFEQASIILDGAPATSNPDEPAEPVAASTRPRPLALVSSARPLTERPPVEWFSIAEPALGVEFYGGLSGDDVLIEQPDGSLACPLTITDDGLIYGHLARWGQCHVGLPGACVTPPESLAAYAHFHVNSVVADSGDLVAVGALTIGCEHAPTYLDAWRARDHYANAGSGWGDVRASNGALGPWISGSLRPDVTDEQLRVLRALTLSGDWRDLGGGLELIGGLAVNVPGFPIAREALVASGLAPATVRTATATSGGHQTSLVASGVVTRCADCQKRLAATSRTGDAELMTRLDRIDAVLARLDRRTQHLTADAAAALVASLGR
jgi:hypothetical protein